MRHAFITAGTKGLGVQATKALLKNGYSVTATYRSDVEAVERLQDNLHEYKDRLQFIQIDIAKKDTIDHALKKTYDRFGRIDILINNAGPYVFERKKLIDYDEAEWNYIIDGNLTSLFHMCKKVIPHMRTQQFGRIVTYGFQGAGGAPGWIYRSAYAAAKVGLVSLTKTIAIEEAEHGITANMICPGDITGEMKEASISFARKHPDPHTPIGRSGTGEDIARTLLFLCADDADMVTGTIIEVTGGADIIHRYR